MTFTSVSMTYNGATLHLAQVKGDRNEDTYRDNIDMYT